MPFQYKNMIRSFDSSSVNLNKNNTKAFWVNGIDSLNNSSNNKNQQNELDIIIKLMKSETEYNITQFDTLLTIYIRKNPKTKNDIIEKVINILNTNNNLYYKTLIKCINTILELLIENFQIINLLNSMIPLLLTSLFQEENIKNINAINEICNFLGKLIKVGSSNITGLIEEIVDIIFLDIFKENPNDLNIYYTYIYLLSEIMKNSSISAFNSVIIKNGIENFTKLLGICFKNKNDILRKMSGELTTNFIKMLKKRDRETKKSYMSILYVNLLGQYEFNIKINKSFPTNFF